MAGSPPDPPSVIALTVQFSARIMRLYMCGLGMGYAQCRMRRGSPARDIALGKGPKPRQRVWEPRPVHVGHLLERQQYEWSSQHTPGVSQRFGGPGYRDRDGRSLGRVPVAAQKPGSKMKFGLVTYLWGQNWDLPTVIANCEKAGVLGVELRTEHAHKVESSLTRGPTAGDVKKRFADSNVTLVGLGTNFAFHYPDENRVRKEIEARSNTSSWPTIAAPPA